MSVSDVFLTYEGNGINLLQYKLIYLAVNGLLLSIGMYKVYTLGLLPLSAADWIDIVPLHSVSKSIIIFLHWRKNEINIQNNIKFLKICSEFFTANNLFNKYYYYFFLIIFFLSQQPEQVFSLASWTEQLKKMIKVLFLNIHKETCFYSL